MSFPDGQPRPDETPAEQEFPTVPEQPQPEMPAEGESVLESAADPVVEAEPSDAAEEAVEAPQGQPYAAPYGSGPFAAPHDESASQPYAASQAPYGAAPQSPYATPQAQPYGAAPQAPYGAPQAQPYGAMPGVAPKPVSAMAIIALVLAILGLLLCWIPFINVVSYVLVLPALVLGIIAIVKTGANGTARGRGFAIAATIVAVLALILTIVFQALYASFLNIVGSNLEDLERELKQIEQQHTPHSPTDGSTDSPEVGSGTSAEGEGDIDEGNYHIKLINMTKSVNDFEDKPTVAVTYELTNQRTDDEYNMFDVHIKAFQNGIQLETAIYGTETPEGYDYRDALLELKPGASHTFVTGFILRDPSAPVLIEAEGLFTDGKVFKEFPLQ